MAAHSSVGVRRRVKTARRFWPERPGGLEHDVRFDSQSNRWFKFTKPNQAGYAIEIVDERVMLLPATPLQYLDRWRCHNYVFEDDVELVGVSASASGWSKLVVSQRDVQGEAPSWDAIENTFTAGLQLFRLRVSENLGGYNSRAYFRGRIGVFDVRPLNCVQTSGDLVVPIDVIPQFFNSHDSHVLIKLLQPSEPAGKSGHMCRIGFGNSKGQVRVSSSFCVTEKTHLMTSPFCSASNLRRPRFEIPAKPPSAR
jgi:hypothetical protein